MINKADRAIHDSSEALLLQHHEDFLASSMLQSLLGKLYSSLVHCKFVITTFLALTIYHITILTRPFKLHLAQSSNDYYKFRKSTFNNDIT